LIKEVILSFELSIYILLCGLYCGLIFIILFLLTGLEESVGTKDKYFIYIMCGLNFI